MRNLKNKVVVSIILFVAVLFSGILTYLSQNNDSRDTVEFITNFIGILSGLIAILSLRINFNLLTSVRNMEEKTNQTIQQVRVDLYYRKSLYNATVALDRLDRKNKTIDFLNDESLNDLATIIAFCELKQTEKEYNNTLNKNIRFELTNIKLVYKSAIELTEKEITHGRVYHKDTMSPQYICDFKVSISRLKDFIESFSSTILGTAIENLHNRE